MENSQINAEYQKKWRILKKIGSFQKKWRFHRKNGKFPKNNGKFPKKVEFSQINAEYQKKWRKYNEIHVIIILPINLESQLLNLVIKKNRCLIWLYIWSQIFKFPNFSAKKPPDI